LLQQGIFYEKEQGIFEVSVYCKQHNSSCPSYNLYNREAHLMDNLPIKIEFKPSVIVECMKLLADIHINKDAMQKISVDDLALIAYDVFYEICSAIMHTLKDEDNKKALIGQLIRETNLRYLARGAEIPHFH
jgi:hypothetical protein